MKHAELGGLRTGIETHWVIDNFNQTFTFTESVWSAYGTCSSEICCYKSDMDMSNFFTSVACFSIKKLNYYYLFIWNLKVECFYGDLMWLISTRFSLPWSGKKRTWLFNFSQRSDILHHFSLQNQLQVLHSSNSGSQVLSSL